MTVAPGQRPPADSTGALVAGALVAARFGFAGHPPDIVDAGLATAAAALLLWAATADGRALRAGAVLVVGAAASIATSRDPFTSLLSLSLVAGAASWLALGTVAPLRGGLLAGVIGGAALHATTALWQRLVTWPDALARQDELQLPSTLVARLSSLRPLGTSLSPDLGAGLCIAGLAACGAIVVDRERPATLRGTAAAVAVVIAAALVASRSFGAVLALGIGVGVALLLTRHRRALVFGGAVAAAGAAAAAVARGAGALLLSAHERLANWRVALDAFVDAPWTGHGLLRFAPAYLERRSPADNVTRYAHGFFPQILAECGLIGLFAVVAAAALLVPALRGTRTAARAALLGGVAALGVRAVIDYDLHVGQSAMVAALLLGLSLQTTTKETARGIPALLVGVAVTIGALQTWRDHAGADSPLARVDVQVALRLASTAPEPAARIELLAPFVDTTPAAAVLSAQARITAGDRKGAVLDVDRALARDPGNVVAHRLAVGLARSGIGDPARRLEEARRWGVVPPP